MTTDPDAIRALRHRAIFESALDFAIIATDRDGRVTDWNPGAERLFGWTAAEMRGEPLDRLFTPEDRAANRPAAERHEALTTGRGSDECWHLRQDGTRFWASGETMPLRDEDGAHLGFVKILRDRTEQRQTAERDARLAAIVTASPDAMLSIDAVTERIRNWNPAAARLFGYSEAEAVGAPVGLLVPPEQPEGDPTGVFRRAMRGEVIQDLETVRVAKDGRRIQVAVTATRMFAPDGRVIGVSTLFRDITERKRAEEALAESEARFRVTFEQAAVGVAHVALDGTWLRVNRRLCDMLGYTEAELRARCFQDVTHPDDLATDLAHLRRLRAGEIATYSLEKRYLRKDGSLLWIELTVALRRDAAGRPLYLISVIQDISARKHAEAALAESEARLKDLLATLDLATVFVRDFDGTILFWSEGCTRLFGWTEQEAVGRRSHELLHTVFPTPLAEIEAALLGNGEWRGDLVQRRRDGTEITVSVRKALRRDAHGRAQVVMETLTDVTAQRRTEIALKESETRLKDLLATLDLASVMVRDLDGTIRFWSEGCTRLYGWTKPEAVGRNAHELLRTTFPVALAEGEAVLRQEGTWRGDLVQRRRDGTEITVAVRKALRRDAAGHPVAVMESVADVTALRQAQAVLRRLNGELEARVQAEVAAREAVQARLAQAEKLTALGQLAGGIAHDFNNVLQTTAGSAHLIESRATEPTTVKRLARIVADAARRGTAITRRLLAFARRGELRAEPVDVPELLAGLREVLTHTLGAGITVQVEAAAALPPVLADRGQLEAALVNLATNARDAMPEGGTLTLTAEAEEVGRAAAEGPAPGAYVRLAVTDTGVGMDAATRARVLEPFFTTKPPGQGTGLGLPMAQSFAEQSGGTLAITSAPGQGTTVSLWLPVAPAGAVAGEPAAPEAPEPATAAGAQAPRVLLVDDEALVRELLAAQLEDLGHAVIQAEGGADALARLDAGEPVDVLISDLAMPEMGGVTLIREAHQRRPHLPTILLTGYVGEAAALAVGREVNAAFSLLRKPVTGQQLADRVATLLEATSP